MCAAHPNLVAQLEGESTHPRFRELNQIWAELTDVDYIPVACHQLPRPDADSICIYEINPGLGILVQPEMSTPGNGGIWNSIPRRVREWINEGRVKLLISSISEPATSANLYKVFRTLENDGANLKNVICWTGASYGSSALSLIKDSTGVDVCRLPYFEALTEADHLRKVRLYAPELDLNKQRSKRYIFINRRINHAAHRVAAFLELTRRDLLPQGHVSMTWQDLDSPSLTFFDRIQDIFGFPKSENRDALIAFGKAHFKKEEQKILPLKLDVDFASNERRNAYPVDFHSNTLRDYYADSYFSVIPETAWDGGVPESRYPFRLISEKTFFAMGCRHPFVMIGAMGDLSRLRELGYKTFPTLVDERYDEIADPTDRIQTAMAEVEKLCRMPEEELRQRIEALAPDLEHNRNLVRTLAGELGTIAKNSLFKA